ncbi:MAG: hypothetical protein DRP60_15530 [Spirochaetes bacterium]|nr:MAG: hypothetical protein DRP60_15530 [Spirochaetota bacterium]
MSNYYEERIHRLLSSVSHNTLQMRISTIPDRNLAIALDILQPDDRNAIMNILPSAKKQRVVQERVYLGRLKITLKQKQVMAEALADKMNGGRSSAKGTWIAPGKKP